LTSLSEVKASHIAASTGVATAEANGGNEERVRAGRTHPLDAAVPGPRSRAAKRMNRAPRGWSAARR
jgi:hypothetical protein